MGSDPIVDHTPSTIQSGLLKQEEEEEEYKCVCKRERGWNEVEKEKCSTLKWHLGAFFKLQSLSAADQTQWVRSSNVRGPSTRNTHTNTQDSRSYVCAHTRRAGTASKHCLHMMQQLTARRSS